MGFFDVFANNVLVKRLRGQTGHADLIAQMVGTRLGDRVLVIGGGDGRLVAAVGAPTGLTGRVTAVEPDAAVANRVEVAATAAGVLVEVEAAGFDRLPFEDAAFDVAVVPMPATVESLGGRAGGRLAGRPDRRAGDGRGRRRCPGIGPGHRRAGPRRVPRRPPPERAGRARFLRILASGQPKSRVI